MGVEDYRVKVGWVISPKRKRLHRALGPAGVLAIMDLWGWCAQNRTDADLSDMDIEDVEMSANWGGQPGDLVKALVSEKIRLLDEMPDGGYVVHDWADHNEWAFKQEDRKGNGSKGGKASAASRRERKENLTKSKSGSTKTRSGSTQVATKSEISSTQIEPVVQPRLNPLPFPSLPYPSFPFLSFPEFNPENPGIESKDCNEGIDDQGADSVMREYVTPDPEPDDSVFESVDPDAPYVPVYRDEEERLAAEKCFEELRVLTERLKEETAAEEKVEEERVARMERESLPF